ncbi:MAG: hypothetical protein GC159_19745 [Phycisphaera sp.]|nr:hypothetical protein [Phycisphaera sp.]
MSDLVVPTYRILLVRPSALGDVARTAPALVSLMRRYPGARVDWLVQDSFADVVRHHPDIGDVIAFPRRQMSGFGFKPGATIRGMKFLNELRGRAYDMVYDLQGLARSGFMTRWTGAGRRVGPADARELGWLGYNRRVPIDASIEHTVDRMLAVLGGDDVPPVRDMRLYVGEADRQWCEQWMTKHSLTAGRYAVVAPTARWKCKCWPIESYEQVVTRLGQVGMRAAAVIGAASERGQTELLIRGDTVSAKPPRIDMVGKTTVGQMMAMIDQAGLVLANDSAALHIAVGLGRRVVSVFGPTDVAQVGPYRYDTGTVCAKTAGRIHYRTARDDQSVIASVNTERVWDAVRRVMDQPPPRTVHDD